MVKGRGMSETKENSKKVNFFTQYPPDYNPKLAGKSVHP
jgi:hypothetical protein